MGLLDLELVLFNDEERTLYSSSISQEFDLLCSYVSNDGDLLSDQLSSSHNLYVVD